MGVEEILFLQPPCNFSFFYFTPGNSRLENYFHTIFFVFHAIKETNRQNKQMLLLFLTKVLVWGKIDHSGPNLGIKMADAFFFKLSPEIFVLFCTVKEKKS